MCYNNDTNKDFMPTFKIEYKKEVFSGLDENLEKDIKINFNLPIPDALEVKLSPSVMKKINYFYSFMKDNKISIMDFYIFSKHEKELNSFSPMKNDVNFDSNEYLDFGDVFFPTFKTDSSLITLNAFENNITFYLYYSNSWTEHTFKFVSPINIFLN